MPLQLKLYNNDDYIIEDNYIGKFSLKILIELLKKWKFNLEEINNINFGIDENIKLDNITDIYHVTTEDILIIYLICDNEILLDKLKYIFKKYNKSITDTNKFNTNNIKYEEKLFQEYLSNINTVNTETIKLCIDKDFQKLINIYYNKPELFGIFLKFIQTDMNPIYINNETIDDLNNIPEGYVHKYSKLIKIIKILNIPVTTEKILITLIKYHGHLNLTIRELICSK